MQNKIEEQQVEIIQPDEGKRSPRIEIPVDDPQAALKFCQALAENLTSQLNGIAVVQQNNDQGQMGLKPAVSVVIPVYDEEENLPLLYQRLTNVLEDAEPSYELVFVDDGSRDRTAALKSSRIFAIAICVWS